MKKARFNRAFVFREFSFAGVGVISSLYTASPPTKASIANLHQYVGTKELIIATI
jgi:hypothetical protein